MGRVTATYDSVCPNCNWGWLSCRCPKGSYAPAPETVRELTLQALDRSRAEDAICAAGYRRRAADPDCKWADYYRRRAEWLETDGSEKTLRIKQALKEL